MRRLVVAALAAAALLTACGDSDGGGEGKNGGRIRIAHLAFPDYLDPARSYTPDGWQALSMVYPGLLTFRHDRSGPASAEVVPGLAVDMPKISRDARTYTLRLRRGLRFSDGRPVRASDFKASIERIIKGNTSGVSLGYTDIAGGEELLASKQGGLAGIRADDATGQITIHLVQPRGTFLYLLAIPFAGVVPADTPVENVSKDPPPGTGRYRFVDVDVPHSYSLVRSERFSKSLDGTAVDAGKVDRIDAVVKSDTNAATEVAQGKLDFMTDNPPPDRLAELESRYPERYHQFATNSTYYFFLNTEAPPFDKLEVRRAANYAIDPEAISRIQGGIMSPAHTLIPPGVPGHPDGDDPYPFDIERARELVERAGAQGADVTVWTNPQPSTKNTAEYYADQLNRAGLDAEIKVVPDETYFSVIGDRSLKPQTGFTNFIQDYPHPANFIDGTVNPKRVTASENVNLAYNADDHALARRIEELNREPELTDDVARRWGEIDDYVQKQALMAVYGNREQVTFMSERMDFENCRGDEHAVYTHDWHAFCLK